MKKTFTLLMAAMFVVATSLSAQAPATPSKKEVKKDMKQAAKDQKAAAKDMKKAEMDQKIAAKDMKKADQDMKMAHKDMKKAQTPPPGQLKKGVNEKSARALAPGQQHLKKDGTPDKRLKENKGVAAPKHLKKDGTPDKRFKENKKPKK